MTPTIASFRALMARLDAEYAVAFTRLMELCPDARDSVTDAERSRVVGVVMLVASVQAEAARLVRQGRTMEAHRHIVAEIGA